MNFDKPKFNAAQLNKAAKAGVDIVPLTEASKFYGGPPLGYLSLEYLLCSQVLLLSRIYHFFGAEKKGKSTLVIDLLDRYFIQLGAYAHEIETENKLNVNLFSQMLQERASQLRISRVTTLEGAQQAMTLIGKTMRGDLNAKRKCMYGVAVDSFRVASKQINAQTEQAGEAQKNYAIEAQLWRTFLNLWNEQSQDMPVATFIVNHAREESDTKGNKTLGCGGGQMLKFLESYRILVTSSKPTNSKTQSEAVMTLKTTTNSNGPQDRRISPKIIYMDPEDPAAPVRLDWDAADAAFFLNDDAYPRQAMKNICVVNEGSEKGLFNESVTGVRNVPIAEIRNQLYADKLRIDAFRNFFRIGVHKTIDELDEQGWFFNSKTAKATASGDDDKD